MPVLYAHSFRVLCSLFFPLSCPYLFRRCGHARAAKTAAGNHGGRTTEETGSRLGLNHRFLNVPSSTCRRNLAFHLFITHANCRFPSSQLTTIPTPRLRCTRVSRRRQWMTTKRSLQPRTRSQSRIRYAALLCQFQVISPYTYILHQCNPTVNPVLNVCLRCRSTGGMINTVRASPGISIGSRQATSGTSITRPTMIMTIHRQRSFRVTSSASSTLTLLTSIGYVVLVLRRQISSESMCRVSNVEVSLWGYAILTAFFLPQVPKYTCEPSDHPMFMILKFTAGPPYEVHSIRSLL